jgi:hypothetical protein
VKVFFTDPQASDGSSVSINAPATTSHSEWSSHPYTLILFALLKGRSISDIHDDEERLIVACMQKRGWDYKAVPFGTVEQSPDYSGSFSALVSYRLRYGYGVSSSPGSDNPDPNAEYEASLSRAARAAFLASLVGGTESTGMDPRSCTAESERSVRSDIPYYDPKYNAVLTEYLQLLEADSQYESAISNWSQCMKNDGYQLSTPDDANTYAVQNFGSGTEAAHRSELALAVADVSCYQAQVLAIREAVDARLLDRLVEEGKIPTNVWNTSVKASALSP